MPFDVSKAAAHMRRVVIEWNGETLELRYNAGEKFRAYQDRSEKLASEFNALTYRLQRESERRGDSETDATDDAYEKLQARLSDTRREIANNVCAVIEWWDLEGDRDHVRSLMAPADQKKHKGTTGQGEIPIDGAWLDALPLPDKFILDIRDGIEKDFQERPSKGKVR